MHVTNVQTTTKLNDLPKKVLFMILAQIDTFRRPRPQILHDNVRDILFEHRIINTKAIRGVCRVFHAWALEHVIYGQTDGSGEMVIDFSDLARLKGKFGLNGSEVLERLLTDFPEISNSEAILFLGDPLHRGNVMDVLHSLEGIKPAVFSRFSFQDQKPCRKIKHKGLPLSAFREWERLDLYLTVCCGLFEGVDNGGEAPRELNWIIRASPASSPCTPEPSGEGHEKYSRRLSFRPDWDESSVRKLLESCRNWRMRHEDQTKQAAEWRIEIHLSVLVGDKIGGFCVHDMVFMPLNRPPTAELKRCSGGKCGEKICPEEGWLGAISKFERDL